MSTEDGNRAGALVATGVCGVLGVAGVVAAVGAVVPAVGDVVHVRSTGVGGMIGYLVGAVLFGAPAVAGVAALRGKPVTGAAALTARPVVALPDGPGLAVRWLAAVPLMLIAAFLPFLGQKLLVAWTDGTDTPGFWNWPPAVVPALVVAGFLLWRTAFGSWPAACRYSALVVLVPATMISTSFGRPIEWLRDVAAAAALVWLSHEVAALTVRVLTRPVATDVVRSRLEIVFPLPDQRPRLRVRHDRVVLDRLHRYPWLALIDSDTTRIALAWAEIRDVRVNQQLEDRTWTPVDGETATIRIPAGPAIRITGGDGTWLVPVRDPHTVVAVIRNRSAAPAAGSAAGPLSSTTG